MIHLDTEEKFGMKVDILIIGGGPAGLSAALILGRCQRNVLVCDDNRQRNRASHAIHGLLGREGTPPGAFLEEARHDLARYDSIALKETRVTDIRREGEGFAFGCSDGSAGSASRILLATEIVDVLPELPGIDSLYGVSVHHCLYCDGFEYAGKPVAAYGKSDKSAELATMMKHWTLDVVALTDGTEESADAAVKLRQYGIKVRREPVRSLEGADGQLKTIRFESGPDLEREGLLRAGA